MAGQARSYVETVESLSVADVMLKYLALEGVRHVFGIPGGGLANILAALKDHRSDFEYIICRHETGAAYMADGYFRATGKLGVVTVTSGPGATNALTGAMNAENGGSSMLVITGGVDEAYYGLGYLQEGVDANLNVDQVYAASTEYTAIITGQGNFQTLFTQALREALSVPRRAVHITVPNNVAAELIAKLTIPATAANYRAVPQGAPREQVREALRQLAAARRPLLFLGNGCREALRDAGTRRQLLQFVQRHGIPVMTTPDAKGLFPESHELSLRVYGMASCMWPQYWLEPARLDPAAPAPPPYDGLLVLGSSLGDLATSKWDPILVPRGPLIQVDLDQTVIGRAFHVSLGVVAEAGAFIGEMAALAGEFPPVEADVVERRAFVARIKAEQSPFASPEEYRSEASPIEPAALVRALQAALPPTSFVFLDAGNCVGWCVHYLTADAPMEVMGSLSQGPMGFAVGAVVGAKLGASDAARSGRPDMTCVAVVGDGAFLMHGAEVSTAKHHGVGAIWVVLRDNDLHMVSQGMVQYTKDTQDPDVWYDLYRLGDPDLVKFAQGLGADAYDVRSPAELRSLMPDVLRRANDEHRPQVVVAHINPASWPPYYPTHPSDRVSLPPPPPPASVPASIPAVKPARPVR